MALARIRTVFLGVAGTPWYSNLYFFNDGGTSIAASATGWVGTFWQTIDNNMVSGLTWATDPEVPTFNETTGKITKVDAVTPTTGAGSGIGEALPYQTQMLVRLITSAFVNGRRVRGRIFVPGLLEVDNAAAVPAASTRTLVNNATTTLITSSASTLAVWSRPYSALDKDGNPIPGKTPRLGSQHAVGTSQVWTQWSVLRSRRD
jgi:hypothetical protein